MYLFMMIDDLYKYHNLLGSRAIHMKDVDRT